MSTPNETTYAMSVEGSVTGEQYRGAFKFKIRLSHRDTLRQDALRRDLLGPNPEGQLPSQAADSTSRVFSKIWIHLLDAPDWWKAKGNGLDLDDEEPVMDLLNQIQTKEKEANLALQKKAEEAKKALAEEPKE